MNSVFSTSASAWLAGGKETDKWLRNGNVWEFADHILRRRLNLVVTPNISPTTTVPTGSIGFHRAWSSASLTIPPSWVIKASLAPSCGCGVRKRRSRSISTTSTRAIITARSRRGVFGKHLQNSLPQRRKNPGQGLRLEQQYFFFQLLDQGHDPALPQARPAA